MAIDPYGNVLGIRDGQSTFDGKTIDEWIAAGMLPRGFYYDPENTLREEIVGFNGTMPNQGAQHALATYENGRIVSFKYAGLPDSAGATAQFAGGDQYHNPKCTVAGVAAGVITDPRAPYNYAVGDEYGSPSGGKAAMTTGHGAADAVAKLAKIAAILNS